MHPYKVNLNWISERKGEVYSPDIESRIDVATPPEFPKGMKGIWSPEHLFTAAVNSCFMTTFLAIAENSKLEYSEFNCESEGILDLADGKYLMTKVILKPRLKLINPADKEKAERIFQKSEKACVISNSIRSTIHVLGVITS